MDDQDDIDQDVSPTIEKKVDDEWKRAAQIEKERFFDERSEDPGQPAVPEASLTFLVSSLYQQSVMGMTQAAQMGGAQGRQELAHAKLNMDLLELLHKKTQGNQTPEETRVFDDVLRDVRTKFVQLSGRLG